MTRKLRNDDIDREGKALSRRRFLQTSVLGGGAASVALAAGTASAAAAPDAIQWDGEVDVIVIGAGAPGRRACRRPSPRAMRAPRCW